MSDSLEIVPYDPAWPRAFAAERNADAKTEFVTQITGRALAEGLPREL
jgi:hypothetical protein